MPAPRTVLLTGAADGLGTLMRGLLPAYGYELRLLDLVPVEGEPDAITARALGYDPQDDSEPYAAKLVAEQGELDPDDPAHAGAGGHFVTDPPIWPH